MSNEKEGVAFSINTKEYKTEFSQEFNDCKTERKTNSVSEIIDSDEGSRNVEAMTINFPFKPIMIFVLLFSVIIGIVVALMVANVFNYFSSSWLKTCILVIGFIALLFIATLVSLNVCIKIIKPFIKMEFLKWFVENSPKDRDLIKKYCDTLVEL